MDSLTEINRLQGHVLQAISRLDAPRDTTRGHYDRSLTTALNLLRSQGVEGLPVRRTLRNERGRQILIEEYLSPLYVELIDKSTDIVRRTKQLRSKVDRQFRQQQKRRQGLFKQIKSKGDEMFEGDDWLQKFRLAISRRHEFTQAQINSLIKRTTGGKKYLLRVTYEDGVERTIPIKRDDSQRIIDLLTNYGEVQGYRGEGEYYGSDAYTYAETHMVSSMEIIELRKRSSKPLATVSKRRAVGWFPYLNGTDLDLTRYQIFNANSDHEDVSCLLHSLSLYGVSQPKLMELSSAIGCGIYITQTNLKQVCDVLELEIIVKREEIKDSNMRASRDVKYGSKYKCNGTINLGQIEEHFFINETTQYTSFFIKHIDELANINSEEKFRFTEKSSRHKRGYKSKSGIKCISSFDLIRMLKAQGNFKDYRASTRPSNLFKPEPHLYNIQDDQREFKNTSYKQTNVRKIPVYFAADMESDVVSGDCHQAIAISFMQIDSKKDPIVVTINPEAEDPQKNLFCRFMNAFNRELARFDTSDDDEEMPHVYCPVIYFHNAKYDTSLFDVDIPIHGECSKDGALYSKVFNFYGQLVEVRDSLKYFGPGGGLSKLPKMLNLGSEFEKGEAIGYTYHTIDNLVDHWINPEDYRVHIKESDHHVFDGFSSASPHFREEGGILRFNPTSYYLDYLKQDVIVLAKALTKFRQLIEEVTGLDAFDSLTISSIGHKLAISRGCYDGVYETKGGLRDFIQQAIRGGRVYANPTHVKTEITGKIQDFDGVSLYPSAMNRLCEEHGIPKGEICKGSTDFNDYDDKNYYIVKIRIDNVSNPVQVPLTSIKEGDSLKYRNEVQGEIIYIDRWALEDLKKYQSVEFKVLEGIYWCNGFNRNIGILAKELHEERCKYKKTNTALANVLKLLMNSIYGKTAMRRSESTTVFVPRQNFDEYLYSNFGVIKEYGSLETQQVRVVKSDYDNGFSLNHVAVAILSTSKRIMNEVFHCMDKRAMPMYYTDTDSIHMRDEDVKPLSETYTEIYGRDLIGKNLGQFHTDFEMKGCVDVMSTLNITLGPKSYLDVLVGKDKNGESQRDIHIRLKGVTEAGINQKLVEYGWNIDQPSTKIDSAVSMFRDLSAGKTVEYILNPKDSVSMFYEAGNVKTREQNSFKRCLSF